MVEVTVEYDYTAQEPDELTIKKGDIIKDVIKHTGGWWEGVLSDKKGMFPDNFVRVIDKEPSLVTLRNKKDVARIRQCRVVFSYNQNHEDELNLKVGDVIDIIGDEEEGWWRGILRGKEGVFPSNFVEEIIGNVKPKPSTRESSEFGRVTTSDLVPSLPAKPAKQYCEVKYAYKAQNDDELTLNEGDIVILISKDGQDQGWWKGELNGKIGVFPDNFVALMSSIDDKLSKEERKSLKIANEIPGGAVKPSSQRKSLEIKPDRTSTGDPKPAPPPVVGKKPIISIKKSPSGSGGIFSEIRKKLVDVVDGGSGSKALKTESTNAVSIESYSKIENNNNENLENNVFDQVERRPLLRDVRANRAKAPGRRLPTSIYKDDDDDVIGIPNGTATSSEHLALHNLTPDTSLDISNVTSNTSSEDFEGNKPKLREWEKHRAPWLEEMKLNQAKRTSTSPGPETRLKLTPTNAGIEPPEESKSAKNSPSAENSPISDNPMSKPMSGLPSKPLKTPPDEIETPPRPVPVVKAKPIVPPPASITPPGKLATPRPVLTSKTPDKDRHAPLVREVTPPVVKPASKMRVTGAGEAQEVGGGGDSGGHALTLEELLERVRKLEETVEKLTPMVEDLKNKLQIETDMRMMLQERLSKNEHHVQL